MNDSLTARLVHLIRPAVKTMDGEQRLHATLELLPIIYTAPYALLALVGIAIGFDARAILDHAPVMALLAVTLTVMQMHTFQIWIETESGDPIPYSGTLCSIVVWGAAFTYGPAVVSIALLSLIAWAAIIAWQRSRLGQSVRWGLTSIVSQSIGVELLGYLAGLVVYRAAGGTTPMSGTALADWGPAALAVLTAELILQLTIVPLLAHINRLMPAQRLITTWIGLIGFSVIVGPFGIILALIYTETGTALYVIMSGTVALVNYLTHYLSRTNERSQQRAREMAHLEELGEALLQAPADLSTLRGLLQTHVPHMFRQDRFEVRLMPPAGSAPGLSAVPWPDLRVKQPEDLDIIDDDAWERLWSSPEPYVRLRRVVPPGAQVVYGDALLVKIETDDPGLEGGEKERLLGGICLLRHHRSGKTMHSLAAVQALASQIGAAYYRAQVYYETMAKQKMTQELEFAGRIQAKFLPRRLPDVPGWSIAAGLTPARQTSGDFYDFVELDDGRLGILVADVADKGTGAALYMALSRTLIRTFALQHHTAPAEALAAANARILTDAESDQFVTVFYGVLDPASGALVYANAGHNPGFLLRADSPGEDAVESLGRTGVPLGLFEDMAWQEQTITLAAGDVLLLYTDGVSEAQNVADDEFGEDRLLAAAQAAIQAQTPDPARAIQDAVIAAVGDFVGSAPQFDDITLLVTVRSQTSERHGKPEHDTADALPGA